MNVLVNISAILHPEESASATIEGDQGFEKILLANLMAAVR